MALVGSVLELGGAEADLKMVCKVLLGKSYDFIFPALLKVIDLQVQMLLTAVIYCISFRQDHFSSDTHRCVAMLPRNGNTVPGTSPSLPFPPHAGLRDQNIYFVHKHKIEGVATLD